MQTGTLRARCSARPQLASPPDGEILEDALLSLLIMEQRSRGFIVKPDGSLGLWNHLCGEQLDSTGQKFARIEVIVPERFTERVKTLLSYERSPYDNPNTDSASIRDYCTGGQHYRLPKKRATEPDFNINSWIRHTPRKL